MADENCCQHASGSAATHPVEQKGTAASAGVGAPSGIPHPQPRSIAKVIETIFSLPVRSSHQPYFYMKPSHAQRMNKVLTALTAAGQRVEEAVLAAKKFLSGGENPDLIRHALGVWLTHSKDAKSRKIMVPSLKKHSVITNLGRVPPSPSLVRRPAPVVSAAAASLPTESMAPEPPAPKQEIVPGEVVTPDTFKGAALLSYWREDYDYNDHHVHWHMVFPGTGVVVNGRNVRVIDRQGELFLYMHSQMVARYETEGTCWGLPLVRPWNQYDDILEDGYMPVPGLQEFYGGYPQWSRWYATKNPKIPDTPDQPVPRALLEEWRDNIYQAIKDGYFWTKDDNGEKGQVMLTPENAHDLVGMVIEAESDALQVLPNGAWPDHDLYGNLHNFGHDKFAEMSYHIGGAYSDINPYGLMISNFGSPRDASFWPWHKHIQYFGRLASAKFPQSLTEHKADVKLSNLVVRPQDPNAKHAKDGGITTVMGPPAVNLLESRAKLNHEPYEWAVDIVSTRSAPPTTAHPQIITLRFFIASKDLMEDYHNWIEMDKVTLTLTSASAVTKVRKDTSSSVSRKMGLYSELDAKYADPWCRCGWPQSMMLPAGKEDGMDFVAFVMATDDSLDKSKTTSLSYCGSMLTDRKYPDPRGMGYPFNRVWTQEQDGVEKKTISGLIADHDSFPFISTSKFKIYRTYQISASINTGPVPPSEGITWNNTIKDFFLQSDVLCMKNEYGYDLGNYYDVMLHGAAIYDACLHKRMPLQMPPFTQEAPDPKHPLWSDEMCRKFRVWLLNDCPKGDDGPTPPPPTPTDVTWKDVKGYFLPSDVKCMKSRFDLSKKDDVARYAQAILEACRNKSMPLQMDPFTQENPDPAHPLWTYDMCNTFEKWIEGGCQ